MELMLIERSFETPSGYHGSTFSKIEYETLGQLSGQGENDREEEQSCQSGRVFLSLQ